MSVFNQELQYDIQKRSELDFRDCRVRWNHDGSLSLTQKSYIENILNRFNMSDCKPIDTPMIANCFLSKKDVAKTEEKIIEVSKLPYSELIGSLLYLATRRPDISYPVSFLSRFLSSYGIGHWKAAKRVLRYLKSTSSKGLRYVNEATEDLIMFSDASFGDCMDTRRSTSGFTGLIWFKCNYLGGLLCKNQCLSVAESEYVGLTDAGKGIWLQGLVNFFGDSKKNMRFSLMCDIKHHWIREQVMNKKIEVEYVPTNDNIADIMTKGLERVKHTKGLEMLRIM